MGPVSSRFDRWRKAGIWQRILSDLQAEAEQRGEIDRGLHFVDATIVRAHHTTVELFVFKRDRDCVLSSGIVWRWPGACGARQTRRRYARDPGQHQATNG